MPLTDKSDIYIALHQDAVPHAIKNMMFQCPSKFNFGTQRLNENPDLLCVPIEANLDLDKSLWVAKKKPLKLFGKYFLDFCYQLRDVELKFHPVDASLAENQFLLTGTIYIGVGIPDKTLLEPLIINNLNYNDPEEDVVISTEKLESFQLKLKAIGHFEIIDLAKSEKEKDLKVPFLKSKIDNLEIEEVTPAVLSETLNVSIYTALSKIKISVYSDLIEIVYLIIKPSTSTQNPIIGENQLKLYLDTEVSWQ